MKEREILSSLTVIFSPKFVSQIKYFVKECVEC